MRFLVQVVASGGGPTYGICWVNSLEEATGVVHTLETMFLLWSQAGYPSNWPNCILHFEGCDVYARREDGALFTYVDRWEPV